MPRLAAAAREALTGCHFEAGGAALWAGANLLGRNRVYRITGWEIPERAVLEDLGSLGSGFPEALAVAPGGLLYRFSDTSSKRSLVDKYMCE